MTPHIITVDGVNQALPEALHYLKVCGEASNSRNGPVVVAPGPVLTVYRKSWQRVLFSEKRDANPFMHFFEALWMLAGRNDVKYVAQFAARMKQFSDDGATLNGAYGHRWRIKWFDQITTVIEHLKANPESRREVITMWEAGDLLNTTSLDLPCNTGIYVDIRKGRLNITVLNRSNDIILGAYGANVVHMSFLHEFLAQAVGVGIGTYIQMSHNFHLYTVLYKGENILDSVHNFNFEESYPEPHFPILSSGEGYVEFIHEVETFVSTGLVRKYASKFLTEVACPMLQAWSFYKADNFSRALEECIRVGAKDWRRACTEWVQRRSDKLRGVVW